MITSNIFEFLKRLSDLPNMPINSNFFRSKTVQATCFCLGVFSGVLLVAFFILCMLYVKFYKVRCQANVGLLKEAMASRPTYNPSRLVHSFPSHYSGLFEFSGGQLRVNTTLYAW